ncbi:MAG: hypothetical protein IK143_04645 [Bacteroidales bacterium]|nr:hypothetical protein [Bacteroidales bacterium]
MKKITKILAFCSLAALLFSACNVDNIGPKYTELDSDTDEVSFLQSTMTNKALSATATTYSVPVVRAKADDALTVTISSSSTNTSVVCPASVTFAAGEYKVDFVLDIAGLAVGTTYSTTLTLTDENTYNADKSITKSTITLVKK